MGGQRGSEEVTEVRGSGEVHHQGAQESPTSSGGRGLGKLPLEVRQPERRSLR